MTVNTDPAKFVCDECPKAFKRNGDLTRHKNLHAGVKKYECEFCAMRFSQRSGLKAHRHTHTGEKPFQCPHCLKTFGDPSSRTRHVKETHLMERPFECPHCTTRIKRRSSFASHLLKWHNTVATKEYLDTVQPPMSGRLGLKRGRRQHVAPTVPRVFGATMKSEQSGTPLLAPVPRRTVRAQVLRLRAEKQQPPTNVVVPSYVPDPNVISNRAQSRPGVMSGSQFPQSYQQPAQATQAPTIDYNYCMTMFGGPTLDESLTIDSCYASSLASSPEPMTPPESEAPPCFVEAVKPNPYEFPLYETQQMFGIPPMYSYMIQQQQHQNSLFMDVPLLAGV